MKAIWEAKWGKHWKSTLMSPHWFSHFLLKLFAVTTSVAEEWGLQSNWKEKMQLYLSEAGAKKEKVTVTERLVNRLLKNKWLILTALSAARCGLWHACSVSLLCFCLSWKSLPESYCLVLLAGPSPSRTEEVGPVRTQSSPEHEGLPVSFTIMIWSPMNFNMLKKNDFWEEKAIFFPSVETERSSRMYYPESVKYHLNK